MREANPDRIHTDYVCTSEPSVTSKPPVLQYTMAPKYASAGVFKDRRCARSSFHPHNLISPLSIPPAIKTMNYLFFLFLRLFQLACAARSGTYDAGWPVGDATWKQTDSDFEKETGISQYKLFDVDGLIYKYQLDIVVSEVQGTFGSTYYFIDATDRYSLTVFLPGVHTVSYNSDDPYILSVKVVEG